MPQIVAQRTPSGTLKEGTTPAQAAAQLTPSVGEAAAAPAVDACSRPHAAPPDQVTPRPGAGASTSPRRAAPPLTPSDFEESSIGSVEACTGSTGWEENDESEEESHERQKVKIYGCPRSPEVHRPDEMADPYFNQAAERLRSELKITWCLHDHYALLQLDEDKDIAAAVKMLGMFNYLGGAVNNYRTLIFARNMAAHNLHHVHAQLERLKEDSPGRQVKLLVFVGAKEAKQPLTAKNLPNVIVCPVGRSLRDLADAKQHALAIATAIRHWDGRCNILLPEDGVRLCQDLADLLSTLR